MGVRENKVETYLDDKFYKVGGLTRKWVCPGRDGVPDRICGICGHSFFVEVKSIDGELSSEQVREHVRLREVGLIVVTVYGNNGVDEFLQDVIAHCINQGEYTIKNEYR